MEFPCFSEELLDVFRMPARIIVSGASNSGKTELCKKLVLNNHEKFDVIIICGCSYHPLQDEPHIASKLIIKEEIIDPWEYKSPHDRLLFILDDCFVQANNSETVSNVFTKGRHGKISCMMVTQNIFPSGKHSRNISLNASHFVLLKQRDLGQVECFSRQLFGREASKKFVEIYKKAVISQPFGHLLVDIAAGTPESIQLRGNILKDRGAFEEVYQWS